MVCIVGELIFYFYIIYLSVFLTNVISSLAVLACKLANLMRYNNRNRYDDRYDVQDWNSTYEVMLVVQINHANNAYWYDCLL